MDLAPLGTPTVNLGSLGSLAPTPSLQDKLNGISDWKSVTTPLVSLKGPRNLRDVIPSGKGRLSTDEYLRRIRRGQTYGWPSLLDLIDTERAVDWQNPSVCCVAGGGPSLQAEVTALRHLAKRGAKIIAPNKSHDWLLKRGLPCHYGVLLDPKDWVAEYMNPNISRETKRRVGKLWAEPKYLVASQCADVTLEKFKGRKGVFMWHAAAGLGESEILKGEFANERWVNIAGASVVGLRAVALAHGLGFRKIHLFGIDGSAKEPAVKGGAPQLYSYAKPHIDATWKPFEVKLNSGWKRQYIANHHMARSVYEFEDSMREWDRSIQDGRMEPFNVIVHGDPEYSAIAMIAAGMGIHADADQNEKYGKPPERKAA